MRTSAVIVLAVAFVVAVQGQGLPRRLLQQWPIQWGANYNYAVGAANGLGGGTANSGSGCLGNLPCASGGTASSGTTGIGAAYGVSNGVNIVGLPGMGNYAHSGSIAGTVGNSDATASGFGRVGSVSNMFAALPTLGGIRGGFLG